MSTMHNSEASPEVHELKHELSEEELKNGVVAKEREETSWST